MAARLFTVSEREGTLAYAYVKSGKTNQARALLTSFLRESNPSWYGISLFYAGLGDKVQAFACLEKAYAQHDSRLRDVKE